MRSCNSEVRYIILFIPNSSTLDGYYPPSRLASNFILAIITIKILISAIIKGHPLQKVPPTNDEPAKLASNIKCRVYYMNNNKI